MKKSFLFSTILLSTTVLCNNVSAVTTINNESALINAIAAGGDYELLNGINVTSALGTVNNNLTIDGKGFGINGTGTPSGMVIANGANVVLHNIGTADGEAWTGMKYNIKNSGTLILENIFFKNNIFSDTNMINGGILRNEGTATLNNITMSNNSVTSTNSVQWGGLIINGSYNNTVPNVVMTSLTNSTFANNTFLAGSTTSNIGAPHGGVLLNQSTINLIDNVTFENNSMTSQPNNTGGAHGTAIDNNEGGYIGTISNSTFKNNKVYRTGYTTFPTGINYHASAAALDNYGTIDKITDSLFEGNSAESQSVSASNSGAAIMSVKDGDTMPGRINLIEDTQFINNHTFAENGTAHGGATSLSNTGTINRVLYQGNYAESAGQHASAGALFVNGEMGEIQNSTFTNNYTKGETYSRGGALYVNKATTVGNISDTAFSSNHADATTSYAQGGAIYNAGTMENITGSFNNNYATSLDTTGGFVVAGGAIYNTENAVIGNITANFDGNYVQSDAAQANAGAIYNINARIGNISGSFSNNYAKDGTSGSAASSGAIMNDGGTIGNVSGIFSGNFAESVNGGALGGAIFNNSIVGNITADFDANRTIGKTMAFAGAIANIGGGSISSISGNFTGNFAKSTGFSLAGAIYSSSNINFKSAGATYSFSGNYIEDAAGIKEYKAVFLDLSSGATKIDFDLSNAGKYVFDDIIYGGTADIISNVVDYTSQYDINITAAGSGLESVKFNNSVINAGTIIVDGAGLEMGSNADSTTHGNFERNTDYPNLVLINSLLKLSYADYQSLHLGTITSNASSQLVFGANFGEGTSDSITADTANGSIILKAIVLSGTLAEGNKVTLFNNASLDISNIDNFNVVYKNYKYGLSFDAGELTVGEKGELNVPIHVEAPDTLQVQDTDIIKDQTELAVWNEGVLTLINSQISSNSNAENAGALKNDGDLTISGGSFTNNRTDLNGGAIYNTNEAVIQGTVFDVNSATLSGGAIYNDGTAVLNNNKFKRNTALQNGGAVYNANDLNLAGNAFENNTAPKGGALYNDGTALLNGNKFTGNTAQEGGAVYNNGEMTIANSSFTDNHATQNGGAIYGNKDLTVAADNYNSVFKDNSAGLAANDIYMATDTKLNLDVKNNGTISFDSGVNGGAGYDILITGDNKGAVNLNSKVENVDVVSVKGAHLNLKSEENLNGANLALDNATLNIANKKISRLNLGSLSSAGSSSFVSLDVNPTNNTADYLNINGSVHGTTKLVLNALSRDKPTDSIAFAHATGGGTDKSFDIYRVMGSSFKWYTSYNAAGKEWSLLTPEKELAPESLSYLALPSAIIEQNRSMLSSIKDKTDAGKLLRRDDYTYEDGYNGYSLSNAWINPVFVTSTIDKPVEIDASITGFEAGFDVQTDIFNKLGVFASYRDGAYDLSGNGEDFYSSEKSTIDITSYNLGGYYRFDRHGWWVLATAYAGTQDLEIATNDGVKADTSATQFGGGAEFGYTAILSNSLTLEPSLGVFYSQTDIDDVKDNFGKTASYDSLGYMEIEGGLKLEKSINFSHSQTKVYVKPSIVQSIVSGNTAELSALSSQNTFEDQTMGRVELGGRFGITNNLFGYGFWNYTLGSSYDSMAVGAGINYNW